MEERVKCDAQLQGEKYFVYFLLRSVTHIEDDGSQVFLSQGACHFLRSMKIININTSKKEGGCFTDEKGMAEAWWRLGQMRIFLIFCSATTLLSCVPGTALDYRLYAVHTFCNTRRRGLTPNPSTQSVCCCSELRLNPNLHGLCSGSPWPRKRE